MAGIFELAKTDKESMELRHTPGTGSAAYLRYHTYRPFLIVSGIGALAFLYLRISPRSRSHVPIAEADCRIYRRRFGETEF